MQQKTLIILNPHAASGRAGKLWTQLEPILWEKLGELVVAVTQQPDEVAPHLERAYASGLTRVIAIGGDGTNHALINALAALNERNPGGVPMVYGNLPVGTGRDWARGAGMPFQDPVAAASWIATAQPRPTDIGLLHFDEGREYFLNIASAGITSRIVERVNEHKQRKPWSFLQAAVQTIIADRPRPLQIRLNNQDWYEGDAYLVAIANGSTFGHGMKIAPDAEVRDGLFDVVLVKGVSRPRILSALYQVYSGAHRTHPGVQIARASQVEVSAAGQMLGFEMDGEPFKSHKLKFEVRPGLLHLLA